MATMKSQVVKYIRKGDKGDAGTDAILWSLVPSVTQLTIDVDGNYSHYDLDCEVHKTVGGTTTIYQDVNSSPLPTGYKVMYTSDIVTTPKEYELNNALSTGTDMKKWITFVLRQPDGKELAKVTVVALSDSSSPFVLDINNEMTSVALTSEGKTSVGKSYSLNVRAFYGTKEVTSELTSWNASVSPSTTAVTASSSTSIKGQVGVGIIIGQSFTTPTEVSIACVHPTYGTRTVKHVINGVLPGTNGQPATLYEIAPSLNEIKFTRNDDDSLSPSPSKSVKIQVKKTVGNTVSFINLPSELELSASLLPTGTQFSTTLVGDTVTVYAQDADNGLTDVVISLTDKNGVLLDKESIPVLKDGKKGATGGTGNGIVSQTSYFVLSNKDKGVTHDNTTGWSTTFPTPTEQQPYVWKCVFTDYSQIKDAWSTAEIVAVYQSGANPNLLNNAAFTSEDNMEAWNVKQGSVETSGVNGRNSYSATNDQDDAYKDVLQQPVYSGTDKRLESNKWYTLSFWAKGYQQIDVNAQSVGYGVGEYAVYLTAGKKYTIQVFGRIVTAQSAFFLRTYIYKSDWSESANCSTTVVGTNTLHSMTFTPKTTGTYYIQSYHYSNTYNGNTATHTGKVYVEWYRIVDGQDLTTYVYPSVINWKVEAFVDGEEKSVWTDGETHWTLGADWSFHKISFKTLELTSTSVGSVLFRLLKTVSSSAYRIVHICMPKLEVGMMATGFIDSASDSKGDRGPTLRGPQEWDGCALEYPFQSGKTGEEFQDVVIYKNQFYSCIKSHIKTDLNYPGSAEDINNGYWRLGTKFDIVATKILLAEYALVKNLGVETIDMKDADGNILFQAKNGNVTCKTGMFDNIEVGGSSVFRGKLEMSKDQEKASIEMTVDNGNPTLVGRRFDGTIAWTLDGTIVKVDGYTDSHQVRIGVAWTNAHGDSYDYITYNYKYQVAIRFTNQSSSTINYTPPTGFTVYINRGDGIILTTNDIPVQIGAKGYADVIYAANENGISMIPDNTIYKVIVESEDADITTANIAVYNAHES